MTQDETPLPTPLEDEEADAKQLMQFPWITPPIKMDHGYNVKLGAGSYLNSNCVFIDTTLISIGARTMTGPNCSFFSGTHPLDPAVRNGLSGPESGKDIIVEEDCWIGGNAVILPGVRVGRGSTVGAGSVVTRDVPPFHVVAGNPARIIRKIKTAMDPEQSQQNSEQDAKDGAEKPMADLAQVVESV